MDGVQQKVHIGTVTQLVLLDKSQVKNGQKITKESLSNATPKIVQKSVSQYVISLWGKECGSLTETNSKSLIQVSKLESVSLKITFAAADGLDNGCIVRVFISSDLKKATTFQSILKILFKPDAQTTLQLNEAIWKLLSDKGTILNEDQQPPNKQPRLDQQLSPTANKTASNIVSKENILPNISATQATPLTSTIVSQNNSTGAAPKITINLPAIVKSNPPISSTALAQALATANKSINKLVTQKETNTPSIQGNVEITTTPSSTLNFNTNQPSVSTAENTASSSQPNSMLNVKIKQEKDLNPVRAISQNTVSNVTLSTPGSSSQTPQTSAPSSKLPGASSQTPGTSAGSSALIANLFGEESQQSQTNDLPPDIVQKMNIFSQDSHDIQRENSNTGRRGQPDLLDGRGAISGFLLAKDKLPQPAEPPEEQLAMQYDVPIGSSSSDDDDMDSSSMHFSENMLARRRRRRKGQDVTAHIGANPNELLEDASNVSMRNWGLETPGTDPADTRFANTPPPVIKKNQLDELFDQISEFPKDETVEPCTAVKTKMLLHQKRALNWMILRENTTELPPFWEKCGSFFINTASRNRLYELPVSIKGGILADDMGLGKTLTTIALILTNHKDGKPLVNMKRKGLVPMSVDDITTSAGGKLSIKKKKEGYLKTKTTTKSDFKKPGFQFRQMYLQQMGKKKKKKSKKKSKKKDSSDLFSSDSDDELNKSTSSVNKHVNNLLNSSAELSPGSSKAVAPKGMFGQEATDRKMTLIICPMSVLSNWTDQFSEHLAPNVDLQIYIYYGPDRVRDINFLKQHDVVISTYGTVSGDYRGYIGKNRVSPLHKINWLRIVLDEGHIIRNARSQQTQAMVELNSQIRWLITGTPIQNRMTDLWSMLKFLRLEPFANRRWWFHYVVKSMKRKARRGEQPYNRVQKLIKHVAIRRMKTDKIDGQPLVKLPERRVVIQHVKFNEDERKLYDAMHKDGKLVVCKYIRAGTALKNYANVLVIIMRLRQLCCHPNLCVKAVKKLQKALEMMDQLQENINQEGSILDNPENGDGENDGTTFNEDEREKLIQQLMQLLSSGDSEECSICLEILQDPVITRCAHVFCSNCINDVIESAELAPVCPLCRGDIDQRSMLKVPQVSRYEEEESSTQNGNNTKKKSEDYEDEDDEPFISSSKVDAVMTALTALRESDSSIKSLVVSQFTSFLDVLQRPLRRYGFHFVRLDGTMNQASRARVIEEFNTRGDYTPTIMLLSLTAGGVGLNLCAASRVFLLDPAWNPAVEEQCFDRAHRLGQKEDVTIVKYVVEDTVEDRMLVLQQQKRELMEKAFGVRTQTPEERRSHALRDIATLLGINLRQEQRRAEAQPYIVS